ncbi:hypothetical protein STSP2_01297 [Anaerohalosphaera lusitana]|uniref:Uncharacterized protein n=1 Tax=Anaerohalosphaera lusitana TaxID=1936003 RepID=A0A1U9NJP0_9BACT|nr:hypothetical protein [Anaerohalosphaera lusitana]AQT68142.1 hypothetical protein STSP2_01297 [Anaerohalosphaera lusitana]
MLLNLFSGLTGISPGNLWMIPIAPAWLILELDRQHGWGYFDQDPINSFLLITTYWLIIGQLITWTIAYRKRK